MTESNIQRPIMLALGGRDDTRIFRNNVGTAQTIDGRFIRFGLCPGSADLIGWKSVRITPDDVGKTLAVFLSVEVKTPRGRATEQQIRWRNTVRKMGGIAVVARSVEEVVNL